MRDETGQRVLTWRARGGIRRHHQVLPRTSEVSVTLRRAGTDWYLCWKPWWGYFVVAMRPVSAHGDPLAWTVIQEKWEVPIKKPAFDPSTLVPPDLPSESKLLAKFAALRAFLSARSYEGGGARVPGKLWIEPTAVGYQVTLIDQDNALRVSGRAGTLDEVFALAELLAGGEGVQWEVDQYQREKLEKKSKKK